MKRRSILPIIAGVFLVFSCESDDQNADPAPMQINSRVNVKVQVGNVLYENVDAAVNVTGYNPDGELKWSEEFDYEGIESSNVLNIPLGYQYYVITATAWGSKDSTIISGQQLYDERVDGQTPTTYVFAPEVAPPKLKSVTKWMESNVEGQVSLTPFAKQEFNWNDDKLIEVTDSEYDALTQSYSPARNYFLEYDNDRVTTILGFHTSADQPFLETTYQYFPNGNVQRIVEQNSGTGITTEADFTYDYTTQNITVSYAHSNGQSFSYKVAMDWKNITWDQTSKGSVVCSEGSYTFDKGINPYRHLGYLDILMLNLSINNKIREDIDYFGCAFPDLTVESYEYSYNGHGFPVRKTIFYSNGRKAEEVYEY